MKKILTVLILLFTILIQAQNFKINDLIKLHNLKSNSDAFVSMLRANRYIFTKTENESCYIYAKDYNNTNTDYESNKPVAKEWISKCDFSFLLQTTNAQNNNQLEKELKNLGSKGKIEFDVDYYSVTYTYKGIVFEFIYKETINRYFVKLSPKLLPEELTPTVKAHMVENAKRTADSLAIEINKTIEEENRRSNPR